MEFTDLKVVWPLLKALAREWFSNATEIQEKVIPFALKKKDILWCAQTWSGKTLAFALPVLQNMYNKRLEEWLVEGKIKRKIKTLILSPTRELASQIWDSFAPYVTNVNFKHTVIFGWVNQFHQVKAIEKWVDILIATPGRLMDLVSQWLINLSFVENVVIDEADRMLDMWAWDDIKKIIKRLRGDRHTLFFSATMPKNIRELAMNILNNPEEVIAHKVASTTNTIKQQVYHIKTNHKRQLLQQIIKRKDLDSIVVFVNSRTDAERILDEMKTTHIKCDSIHKDKSQNARQNALKALKSWEIKVLIATDIASRWLDINNLSCVINYHIPWNPEDYVHRIWRTARAWKEWLAISFCIEADKERFTNIEKLIWKTIEAIKDDSFKDEIVPKEKYLPAKKFIEQRKPKVKWKIQYWKQAKFKK